MKALAFTTSAFAVFCRGRESGALEGAIHELTLPRSGHCAIVHAQHEQIMKFCDGDLINLAILDVLEGRFVNGPYQGLAAPYRPAVNETRKSF
jgi:hypothetical protein